MPVEPVNYIADLDPAAPTGAAPKSEGDDHLRNIKKGLKNSFIGFAGAILVTGVDGGAANAYTLTPPEALVDYTRSMFAVFVPVANNTGPTTLNISGLGAKEIVSVAGVPLAAGDLTAGRFYTAFYDGTKFRLDNVTQNYVDQLVISGTVPGVNDPANAGKVFSSNGSSGLWVSLDGRGAPALDKGNSGTTAQVVNYADGEGQTITATGAHQLSATGFPAGRMAGILLRMIGYGNFALTTTGIIWIKADQSQTVNFATSGITLSTGESFVSLISYGDGKVYAKVVR
jgi:hypothetical protein